MKSLIFISIAFITQNILATPVMPVTPTYATCPMVTVTEDGESVTKPDPACVSQNESARTTYNSNVDTYNNARQVVANLDPNSNLGYLLKPDLPAYKDCRSQVPPYATNSTCTSQNQSLSSEYDIQLARYNDAKTIADEAETQRLAQVAEEQAALAAINAANDKNKDAYNFYNGAYNICRAVAVAYAAGFDYADAAVWYGMADLADQQAQKHAMQEYQGCLTANQVSTNTLPCAVAPAPSSNPSTGSYGSGLGGGTDPTNNPILQGCDQSPPSESCILPSGFSIGDLTGKGGPSFMAGPNGKGNGKGIPDPAKEKIYKNADYSSEKAMIASGISPNDAKAISGMIDKLKKNIDSKAMAALNKKDKPSIPTAASALANNKGSSSSSSGTNGALNGDATANKDSEGARAVASLSEGFAKDFNGDPIGLPGDDIFKMMSRRYKLKTSQNNFIAP